MALKSILLKKFLLSVLTFSKRSWDLGLGPSNELISMLGPASTWMDDRWHRGM